MSKKFEKSDDRSTKVKLTVFDRLEIPGILPDKESFEKAVITNNIREKINITQSDIEKYNIKTNTTAQGSFTTWDNEKDKGIIVKFTELEMSALKGWFKDLADKKEIKTNANFISLYKKFTE